MRAILGFVLGACLPVALGAVACLAEGKSPVYALFAVYYSLPTAILFLMVGAAWDVSVSDDRPRKRSPILLEPPPRSRRGPSRRGRHGSPG